MKNPKRGREKLQWIENDASKYLLKNTGKNKHFNLDFFKSN